jgi:hypothetical protein
MGLLHRLLSIHDRPLEWWEAEAAIKLYEAAIANETAARSAKSSRQMHDLRVLAGEQRREFEKVARGHTIDELDVIRSRG